MASGRSDSTTVFLHEEFTAWRKKFFATRRAFAKHIGCSPSLISRYELGLSAPPLLRLLDLDRQFPGLDSQRKFFRNGHHR